MVPLACEFWCAMVPFCGEIEVAQVVLSAGSIAVQARASEELCSLVHFPYVLTKSKVSLLNLGVKKNPALRMARHTFA